jgi:hypothetical protein
VAVLKSLLRKSGAMGTALDAITIGDIKGFFGHCGYRVSAQSL